MLVWIVAIAFTVLLIASGLIAACLALDARGRR